MNTVIFVSIVVRRNVKKYIGSFISGKTSCIYNVNGTWFVAVINVHASAILEYWVKGKPIHVKYIRYKYLYLPNNPQNVSPIISTNVICD